MKFKILDETHFNKNTSFDRHYQKHVSKDWKQYFRETEDELFEPISSDEYDMRAWELTQEPVFSSDLNDSHNVVGFVDKFNRITKYDKINKAIVVYTTRNKNDHETITYYKVNNDKRYIKLLNNNYNREINAMDEYYND